jgi:phosphoribosylformylglycinamidine (FGAM) synthase PurS component
MIYRIDVRGESVGGQKASADPLGEATRRQITDISSDPGPIHTRRIFLIDSDADRGAMQRVADELLADPIAEAAELVAGSENNAGESRIEIHLKPGVMDPVAASTEMAIRDLGIHVTQVRTGRSFVFEKQFDRPRLEQIAGRVLTQPRGASVFVAGGDESRAGLFPRSESRADGYRTGNHSPRPGASTAFTKRSRAP